MENIQDKKAVATKANIYNEDDLFVGATSEVEDAKNGANRTPIAF